MATWKSEEVEKVLTEKGWLKNQRDIENGIQFVLSDDTPIDWYTTGKVVVRGKLTSLRSEAKKLFPDETTSRRELSPKSIAVEDARVPTRVFIVYGHDVQAREQLELILRRLKLEPIVLQNLPATGDTIIEKLETLTAADFACVLLTPDDEGYRSERPSEKQHRARQNVVLELGMVLAKLGRKRVAILVKGDNLERPSDISGLIYLPFQEHVDTVKTKLASHLQEVGFPIQVKDLLP